MVFPFLSPLNDMPIRPHPSPAVTPSPSKGKAIAQGSFAVALKYRLSLCNIDIQTFEALFRKNAEPLKAFPFKGEGVAKGDG